MQHRLDSDLSTARDALDLCTQNTAAEKFPQRPASYGLFENLTRPKTIVGVA